MSWLRHFKLAPLAIAFIAALLLWHFYFDTNRPLTGQLAVLDLLPDETLMGVVVTHLSDFDTKVATLSKSLAVPLPGLLTLTKQTLGITGELKEDASAAIVLVASPNGKVDPENVVFLLPVTDYRQLLDRKDHSDLEDGISLIPGPKSSLIVAEKNGYVVAAQDTSQGLFAVHAILKRSPILSKFVAPLKGWLSTQDVSLFTTNRGVICFLEDERKRLIEETPESRRINDKTALCLESEISQCALGARLEDDCTLRVSATMRLSPFGTWKSLGAKIPAVRNEPLSGLPAGPFLLAFDGSFTAGISDWLAWLTLHVFEDMATNSVRSAIGTESWRQFSEEIERSWNEIQSIAFTVRVPQPFNSRTSPICGVLRVTDSQQYLQDSQSAWSSIDFWDKKINPSTQPNQTTKHLELGGIAVDERNYHWGDAFGHSSPLGLHFFDPNALSKCYFAAVQPNLIGFAFAPDRLKDSIAAARDPHSGLASDTGIKTTLRNMPSGAQWIGFINSAGIIDCMRLAIMSSGNPNAFELPNFSSTLPIGFAARLGAESFDAVLVCPPAFVEEMADYGDRIRR